MLHPPSRESEKMVKSEKIVKKKRLENKDKLRTSMMEEENRY